MHGQGTDIDRHSGCSGAGPGTGDSLAAHGGGSRFDYDNESKLPAGKVGEAVSGVVSGRAQRGADESLARLKALAEA